MARVVLVVDDEPVILDITAVYLEELGYEVMTTTSSADALRLLSSNPRVEVLITDAQLPSMDGFQLADEARRAIPALAVIIISGGHGAPGYTLLRKPFSRDQLASTLQQVTGAG